MNKGYIVSCDHIYYVSVFSVPEGTGRCLVRYSDGHGFVTSEKSVFKTKQDAYSFLKKKYEKKLKNLMSDVKRIKKLIDICDERSKNESMEIK